MTLQAHLNSITQDGILWLSMKYWRTALTPSDQQNATKQIVELLAAIPNQMTRDTYIKRVCEEVAKWNANIDKAVVQYAKEIKAIEKKMISAKDDAQEALMRSLTDTQQQLDAEKQKSLPALSNRELTKYVKLQLEEKVKEPAKAEYEITDEGNLPDWAQFRIAELMQFMFLQKDHHDDKYPIGIYFNENNNLRRLTNFVINPLYQILDPNNGRRLLEIKNKYEDHVVEMPNRGLISQDAFFMELINKGAFTRESGFGQQHFLRLVSVIAAQMPKVWQLNSLGWQSEGFFAFANKIITKDAEVDFDDLGIAKIEDKFFLSPGISKIHKDDRQEDNIYENDLFLKYKKSPISFNRWMELFYKTYGHENAVIGIAFVFITLYKDVVTKTTKCPLLYAYGQKGSGKSEFAESITNLWFSGKDATGELIKPMNLNPGQVSVFAFFNKQERFSNCPGLYNEFDENNIEDYKFGAFKASYDGEGREVGDGSTGKARKTRIQKYKGTNIIVGQYLSTKDDGSVTSRGLTCEFVLSRMSTLTEDIRAAHTELKNLEKEGLSSLIADLIVHRAEFSKQFPIVFWKTVKQFDDELKANSVYIETRLMRNYSLAYAVCDVLKNHFSFPFDMATYKKSCMDRMVNHNQLMKNNNALSGFWKSIEFLLDSNQIHIGKELALVAATSRLILANNEERTFTFGTQLCYVRFSVLYNYYAKSYRERIGKAALNQDTLELYLKDQTYYIGPIRGHRFSDGKSTSCIALDYAKMMQLGISLFNIDELTAETKDIAYMSTDVSNDLPF